MLIDSGSSAVLIRRDVATRLQLRLRKLPEPYRLSNAWGTGEDASSEWVKLRVSLPDNSWTSVSCRAIIVDSLCAPVILGKPFLESNCIVEDHNTRTLVDKRSGRDLLSAPKASPSPPLSSSGRREALRAESIAAVDERRIQHIRFLRELHDSTTLCKVNIKQHTVETGDYVIAAVRHRIELLAFQERLDRENVKVKAEFADLFPNDIPHIDHLPSDVYHRFVLKDADMVIVRRQYDCPKKYREVWKQLLDQHLAAGRL